mmetsp:Transcript_21293/g.54379  ORF Transcript_21293/g.54379 Transcript_21293/m.54379 type:complete len:207 (-) Transcript_21293:43-663(-)
MHGDGAEHHGLARGVAHEVVYEGVFDAVRGRHRVDRAARHRTALGGRGGGPRRAVLEEVQATLRGQAVALARELRLRLRDLPGELALACGHAGELEYRPEAVGHERGNRTLDVVVVAGDLVRLHRRRRHRRTLSLGLEEVQSTILGQAEALASQLRELLQQLLRLLALARRQARQFHGGAGGVREESLNRGPEVKASRSSRHVQSQ